MGWLSNPEFRFALLALLVSAVLGMLVVLPFAIEIGGYGTGYAISFLSLVFSLTAFITALFFLLRAKKLEEIFDGKGLLCHWKYGKSEWLEFAEREHDEEKGEKKQLFLIVAGMALLVGGIFALLDQEAGVFVLAVMGGLIVLIGMVAYVVPEVNYARNRGKVGEAYTSAGGVFLNGAVHLWNLPGFSFGGARLRDNSLRPCPGSARSAAQSGRKLLGGQQVLEISYSAPNGRGAQEVSVRVPVPKGKAADAKSVLKLFGKMG